MKNYAFIFARGGSKGVPGKNIRSLDGKPLIAYSIEIAKNCDQIDDTFVSTDDNIIKNIALEWGAEVIDRPYELAQDNSPEWLAWKHAVNFLENRGNYFDIMVSIPPTAPLRNNSDVKACINCLDNETDVVITMVKASRNPWFNMVRKDKDGFIKILLESDKSYFRRQDTPSIYDMTTVAYITRPDFVRNATGIFDGRIRGVEIPAERALDIDTELDFTIAEYLIKEQSTKY